MPLKKFFLKKCMENSYKREGEKNWMILDLRLYDFCIYFWIFYFFGLNCLGSVAFVCVCLCLLVFVCVFVFACVFVWC